MKRQFQLFLIAIMFYTRIPIRVNVAYTDEKLNASTRYFPLIGYVVGAISFIGFYLTQFILPIELAILASFIVGILTTGAFHEDGLADFFDGFGGGWTTEKILDIMKDSRVGTYGMVASLVQLAIKFYTLFYLVDMMRPFGMHWIFLLFIIYHSLARFTAIQLCFLLDYVRLDETSKAKPIAKKQSWKEILGVYIFGLFPVSILILQFPLFLGVFIPIMFLIFYFKSYLKQWIGGYTGDCLGAVEQIAEGVILLTILALWKYISFDILP
ncbi:MAG TPA: adenosylcobinamide-GDP ribazoletransferase [Faecalibacter sp.]